MAKKPKPQQAAGASSRYTDKLQRRPQQRISTFTESFFSTLSHFVTVAAIIIALATTAIAVLTIWRPEILDEYIPIGNEYRANIVVESLFFWIEIAAIIIGLRLLERYQQSAQRKKNLVTIANALTKLEQDVYDLRVRFAADLDAHDTPDGAYSGASFTTVPVGFELLRSSLMSFMLNQRHFHVVEGHVLSRITRTLDSCVSGTRGIAEVCMRLSQTIAAAGPEASEEDRAQLRKGIEKLLDYESDIYINRLSDLRTEVDTIRQPQRINVFASAAH